jgi:hypothetical protein
MDVTTQLQLGSCIDRRGALCNTGRSVCPSLALSPTHQIHVGIFIPGSLIHHTSPVLAPPWPGFEFQAWFPESHNNDVYSFALIARFNPLQPCISLQLQTDNELTITFAVSGGQHAITLLWQNRFL